MAENEIISAIGYFNGSNSKSNFDVQIKFRFSQTELPNALQFVTGIGRRMKLVACLEGESNNIKLGIFNVYSMRIDKDMNCDITFKSNLDNSFVGNFEKLMIDEAIITIKGKLLMEDE